MVHLSCYTYLIYSCKGNIVITVISWKTVLMYCRTEVGKLAGERAALLKKLVEVEMDGKAAGEQMIKLRDTVRRLKEVNLVCMVYMRYSTLLISPYGPMLYFLGK